MFKINGFWWAIVAMIIIGGVYGLSVYLFKEIPAASSFIGHLLGIVGFILMLLTEFLYSFRKRSRRARWGKMSDWLEFHIFTGLVGPFLVLLHSSWKFQGLAGVVTLMTLLIVVSGLVGRYIFTSIPQSEDGQNTQILEQENMTRSISPDLVDQYPEPEMEKLQQLKSIEKNRRRLAIWHLIHIPMGMVLFTSAFIHIFAAIYYSTLLH